MAEPEMREEKSEVIRVLVVEDNPGDAGLIEQMLGGMEGSWFDSECVNRLEAGLERLAQRRVDVVMLDLGLLDSQGLVALSKVHAQAPGVPIVVLGGPEDGALSATAMENGAQDYLVKGQVDSNLLVHSLRYAIGHQRMLTELEQRTQESQALLYSLDNVIQRNPDGIIIVDKTGVVRFVNPAVESLLDRKSEELIGETFGFPTVAGEKTELEIIRGGGEPAAVEMHVVEMEWKGEVVYLASLRDITRHKHMEQRLERSFVNLAETVSRAVGSRDPYTARHQRRVAELARLVGGKMRLDEDRLQGLYIGGLLHDIGNVSVPASILTKSAEVTDEEWAVIHAHTKQGYNILKDANLPWPVADIALHHHERLDGSGYPYGISGDELSLENRIIAVCDVVEAMGSHRPYRPARSREEVLEEIKGGRGTKYDPDVVDVMLELVETREFGL